MTITVGIDWAEDHHDAAIMSASGSIERRLRFSADAAGFTELLTAIAEHGGHPDETSIGIETDKNLLVTALKEAGFTVYALNPRAVARYRERFGQAGGKSDAKDAMVLADILRTDRHQHRPMPSLSHQNQSLRVLARQHQEALWALHDTLNRLRSVLLEFYPQALRAFPKLTHRAALAVLAAAPTPTQGSRLTPSRVSAALKRAGRRNDPDLVEHIVAALRHPSLCQPQDVERSLGITVAGLVAICQQMHLAIAKLEEQMRIEFHNHPTAPIMESVPGIGVILGARILAEIGDDPSRFTTARGLRAFAGTAPVTRASGRSHYVKARRIRNKRLADACHWWAFASLTASPGARAYYDHRRALGDRHNAALRNLANKLVGRLWWCLQTGQLWDDQTAWPTPSLQAAA